jgi:hypothetical protein
MDVSAFNLLLITKIWQQYQVLSDKDTIALVDVFESLCGIISSNIIWFVWVNFIECKSNNMADVRIVCTPFYSTEVISESRETDMWSFLCRMPKNVY